MKTSIRLRNREVAELAIRALYTSLPNQAQNAANLTAYQIKDALIDEMRRVFDRPTPYTLNAVYVRAGSGKSRDIKAHILLREFGGKSRSEKYLLPQVFGGSRRLKSFESALRSVGVLPDGLYAVPGQRAPLDAYGNISAGFIVQILSYFRAFGEQGYRANITEDKRSKLAKGTRKKRGYTYFAIKEPGRGLMPGIYRRQAFGFGHSVEPMLMFVKRPSYRRLLRWREIAEQIVSRNFQRNLSTVTKEGITIRDGVKP